MRGSGINNPWLRSGVGCLLPQGFDMSLDQLQVHWHDSQSDAHAHDFRSTVLVMLGGFRIAGSTLDAGFPGSCVDSNTRVSYDVQDMMVRSQSRTGVGSSGFVRSHPRCRSLTSMFFRVTAGDWTCSVQTFRSSRGCVDCQGEKCEFVTFLRKCSQDGRKSNAAQWKQVSTMIPVLMAQSCQQTWLLCRGSSGNCPTSLRRIHALSSDSFTMISNTTRRIRLRIICGSRMEVRSTIMTREFFQFVSVVAHFLFTHTAVTTSSLAQ